MRISRQSLLVTEGGAAQRPNVELGTAFLRHPNPGPQEVQQLQRRVGFRPALQRRLRTDLDTETRVGKRRLKKFKKAPPDDRRAAVDRELGRWDSLDQRVQRHAQTISRALPFHHTPDNDLYVPTPMKNRSRQYDEFPRGGSVEGSRKKRKAAERNHVAQQKLMQKVLHFVRRTGAAFNGNHEQELGRKHGIFSMRFGKNDDMAGAYNAHLRHHLPSTIANAFRAEQDSDTAGDATHHTTTGHNDLWRAVGRHLSGIEECRRTPLLGTMLTSASAGS